MTSATFVGGQLFKYTCAAAVLLQLIPLVIIPASVSAAATTKMSVLHPAFANAGKKDGLQIWRVEVSFII